MTRAGRMIGDLLGDRVDPDSVALLDDLLGRTQIPRDMP